MNRDHADISREFSSEVYKGLKVIFNTLNGDFFLPKDAERRADVKKEAEDTYEAVGETKLPHNVDFFDAEILRDSMKSFNLSVETVKNFDSKTIGVGKDVFNNAATSAAKSYVSAAKRIYKLNA